MSDLGTRPPHGRPWRDTAHEVIFEADTAAGKLFDVVLIVSILASVLAVMLESVPSIRARHGALLIGVEWFFTVLFTVEYAIRLASVARPWRYATSVWGCIDLLGFLPTYVALVIPGSQVFSVVRVLRVLRVFRVLRLVPYLDAATTLKESLIASRRKITVFVVAVLTLVVILGSMMYLVEGEESGFTSIPLSVYWAIVTLTTVGYGDISPQTPLGRMVASVIMILGYGIIAVPTGIVTAELVWSSEREISTEACPSCAAEGHDADALFCRYCGAKI